MQHPIDHRTAALLIAVAAATTACDTDFPQGPTMAPTVLEEGTTNADDGSTGADGSSSSGDGSSTGEPLADHDALDAYIYGLGPLQLEPAAGKHEIPCDPLTMDCVEPWEQDGQTCEKVFYAETRHTDSFLAVDPDAGAMWPGEILRASELDLGFLSPLGLERADATFSVALNSLVGTPVATMEPASRSQYVQKMRDVLDAGVSGTTAADIEFNTQQIFSKSHFAMSVGVGITWANYVDFDAMYDFSQTSQRNKFLVDFHQSYYTVDLDPPARPSSLFGEFVGVEDVSPTLEPGDAPMYVQSVTFGRRAIFAIESTASSETVGWAIHAGFAGFVNGEYDQAALEVLETSTIKVIIIGGDGNAAVQTLLGPSQMAEYILDGGSVSADSPGKPLRYRVAYLDNKPGKLALTAVFPEIRCH